MSRAQVVVALGANLADPAAQVLHAVDQLAALPDTQLLKVSPLYRSAAVGYVDQPDFVNAVALIETAMQPDALLVALQAIEQACGRERTFRNAPRTLDLDILLYDDLHIVKPSLTIPHPRMSERAFVLLPLLDILPECIIPGLGPAQAFLSGCADQVIERLK
ncbi:2-amino-4-hydroxy-6-hydroxymethyldihydropteridine diphosphokinase [Chitinivorax tropicus]|uniref:2-amino-4-hydroxy-6-hydroxymethyldihydropteridine pyrophosphokinase n=1 Tax=Chitinivorax tropicus TaxID=714531 RepID=A0A840MNP4_9PROT|nr:2-amino-4-hydroxy-6-hydroxymethyldihydropteridine diphosphokinase [Chitinivorax tropicus]MBB5018126.1 2-amino-4-hydroxy-6-hydroxymethyldihydropteridine diphosphokinase [Chitinivorax tropicus]